MLNRNHSIAYTLVDLAKETFLEPFHHQELRVEKLAVFNVEHIIRWKGHRPQRETIVEWEGYPESMNS